MPEGSVSENSSSKVYHATNNTESPTTRPSTWSYVRWLVWTTLSGLFSCRSLSLASTTFHYFFLHQPAPITQSTSGDRDESDQSESSSVDSAEFAPPTRRQKAHSDSEIVVTVASTGSQLRGKFSGSENDTRLLQFYRILSISTPDLVTEAYDAANYQLPFTLLSSVQLDLNLGLIDLRTHDAIVTDLVLSTLPRNLSSTDSVGTSSTQTAREMYTNREPPLTADETKPKQAAALTPSSSSDSLDQERRSGAAAYPGPHNFDDSSSSLMSSALESPSFPSTSDFSFDSIGGHTATRDVTTVDRQSRDKSPVMTVNSALRPAHEYSSVPTFAGIDGFDFLTVEDTVQDDIAPKPRRSSSLKSSRTPPSTPSRQKAVRFADTLGLDLTTVRHVFDLEHPPKIPTGATSDLNIDSDDSIARLGAKQFSLCFTAPGSSANFLRRIMSENVALEDAHVEMPRGVLTGTIRVRSLGFEKRVAVRITYNNWATYFDTQAAYVHGSYDGITDRFSFSLVFPDTMAPSSRAQFAIHYDTHSGQQFWDNNYGHNYSVACYAKATDLAGDGSWIHFL